MSFNVFLRLAGDVVLGEAEEVSYLGIQVQMGPKIVIKPSFAISLEELKSKLRGKIRISKRSTLILDGNAA